LPESQKHEIIKPDMTKKVKTQQTYLRANVSPESLNRDDRTVDVVFTKGSSVRRYDYFSGETFIEELSLDEGHVDLSRLQNGAPVLNNHNRYSLEDQIGVVVSAELIPGKQGNAQLKFSKRDSVEDIFQDIEDGVIRNVSFGYTVDKFTDVSGEDDEIRTLRAVDWQPFEISMVAVPADAEAQVRGKEDSDTSFHESVVSVRDLNPADNGVSNYGDRSMSDDQVKENEESEIEAVEADESEKNVNNESSGEAPAEEAADAPAEAPADVERSLERAAIEERERAASITDLANVHGLGREFADKLIKEGVDLAVARERALNKELTDGGSHFRGMSLIELSREFLPDRGSKLSKVQVAERALHSTSDFPTILANVVNKTLRGSYEEAPQTFRPLVREASAPDFKNLSRAQLGEAPKLEKVGEHGEFERGTIGEGGEEYRLETFGKVVGVTRQVLINDDMSAFTRIPQALGYQAANLESDLVWGEITGNRVLSTTGQPLFSAAHGNLGTGAASALDADTLTSLAAARLRMRKQTGLDGETKLNIMPFYLIVPPELETEADKIVSSISPEQAGKVNPFQGLQKIVEPRLSDAVAGETAWYLAANIGQVDMIEIAYLDGVRGPTIETRNGFDIDGLEIKARMDVGARALDFRGLDKSEGA